ncbi:cytochrome P450 3A7-like [Penaeus japonicus]|uniref:cytochrome P450 3A7-like n=1 Tax=Penaeus japonicus TaxID=27405 RepID=UPI001C715E9D|nr:cytochrome P450 3A7-like [Penaeus japonicus]
MTIETWLLAGLVLVLAWAYSRWKHSYWSSRGVPTPPFLPFIGHLHKTALLKKRYTFDMEAYYNYGGSKFCGLYSFHKPCLLVGDPELLKHIFVKDFDCFTGKKPLKLTKRDRVITDTLVLKTGEEWKRLRSIMSPTFSSGRMKGMFPLVCQKADDLVSFCLREARTKSSLDMKHNFGRFTLDTIASCAFGIECNAFGEEKSAFCEKVDAFFKISTASAMRKVFVSLAPQIANAFNIQFSSPTTSFFEEVALKTIAARKKGSRRGDFLDLLLETQSPSDGDKDPGNQSSKSKQGLDDPTIVSQCVVFLIAGYGTTASALSYTAFLLAKYPEAQERLRRELHEVVEEHGDVTYQGIMEAKFLDACIMETLRLYPTSVYLERMCERNYRIPGTDLTIAPGTVVSCPVWTVHRDPKYWPEPEEFRPERFLPENKANIANFTHMPFGVGPRNCIAQRFALMEAKIALAKLLLASDLRLAPGCENVTVSFGFGSHTPKAVNLILKPLKDE